MSAPGPGFKVTRENVLEAHKLFALEARRLATVVAENGNKLSIGACGKDPVSSDAREGYNAKLTNLRTQCESYVQSLSTTVTHLHAAALFYGYTEDQINSSLSSAAEIRQPLLRPDPLDPTISALRPYMPQSKAAGDLSPRQFDRR